MLLPAPTGWWRRAVKKIARQRLFQRRRAQPSKPRHVASVRAVWTAKEPFGCREPGSKAAQEVWIVADRHRNDRTEEEFTGRDVR